MKLYLMRHAHALDGGGNDFWRTLSEKGKVQAEAAAAWLGGLGISSARVVSSPYPRARETADIVAAALRSDVLVDERLASGAGTDDLSALAHELGEAGRSLFFVGHAPDLDRFCAHLLGARPGAIEMKKGAVAAVSLERSGLGGGTLEWLVNPSLPGGKR